MKNPFKTRLGLLFALPLALLAISHNAPGQSTWTGNTNANWSTTTNWTGTIPSSGGSSALVFDVDNLTGALSLTSNNDFTSYTATSLTVGANATQAMTLTGSAITLGGTIESVGAAGAPTAEIQNDLILSSSREIHVAADAPVVISGDISESGGSRSFTKNTGTGTLTLSGNNTYSGGTTITQGKVVAAHNSALGTGSVGLTNTDAILELANGITIDRSLSAGSSGNKKTLQLQTGATSATYSGAITVNEDSSGNFALRAAAGGTLTVSNVISGTTGAGIVKEGTGTVVLSADNTFTGQTTAGRGILRLDYSTNTGSKLSDSAILYLKGGTIDLAGGSGSYIEVVSETRPNAVGASAITRSSGNSTIQLNAITLRAGGATVDFGADSIATTDTGNLNGLLLGNAGNNSVGWATVGGTHFATNSTGGADGAITKFTDYTDTYGQEVQALGGTIPNASTKNINLINGGSSGNLTITGGTAQVNTLLQSSSDAATVEMTGKTLRANAIMVANGAAGLTIGTAVGQGDVTRYTNSGSVDFVLANFSSNTLLINSDIPDWGNGSPLTKTGTGVVELAGANTYTSTTNVNAGTLLLSGSISNGLVNVNAGTLLVNGSTGSGAVSVSAGGTLGGTGTIGGATTLNREAKLSPGSNSADDLDFSNGLNIQAALENNGALIFTLGTSSDRVDITGGTLTIGTGLLSFADFAFTAGPGFGPNTYTLFDAAPLSLSGTLAPSGLSGLIGGYTATLGLSGTDVVLNVIPEPSTWALLAASLTVVVIFRRRRRT